MNERLDRIKLFQYLERIIVHILVMLTCVILFVPLVVSRDVLYLYVFPKVIAFRILIEVMAGMWIFLCIYKKTYRPNFRNPIIASLTVFIFFVVLSGITSIDPYRSMWSYQERMLGIFTMLHLWLFVLILSSTFRSWREWRLLFIATVAANALVGLYGIGQKFHLPFLFVETDPLRMASTLGNPIYLGAYALMHLFITAFLFFRVHNNVAKLFLGLAFFFNLFMLFASATRGVVLACGIAGVGWIVMWILHAKRSNVSRTLIHVFKIGTIMCVVAGLFLYTPAGKTLAENYLPPFANKLLYQSLNDPARLALWETGLKGFFERPLTGWGWSNFDYVNNVYITQTNRVRITNTWNDQSHNQVVDILAMTGIFGALAYGALWFFLLREVIRRLKILQLHGAQQCALLSFLFLEVAYFLQNLTVFDTPAPVIVFYFSIAAAVFLGRERIDGIELSRKEALERRDERDKFQRESKVALPLSAFAVFPLLIILVVGAVVVLNSTPFRWSILGISAIRSLENHNIDIALKKFNELFSQRSFVIPEFREQIAEAAPRVLADQRYTTEQKRDFMKLVVEENKKNLEEHPKNFRYFLRMMNVYRDARQFEPTANLKIRNIAENAVAHYPMRFELYKEIAESYALDRDFTNAIASAKKAVEYDQIKARSLWFLAMIYAQSGDIQHSLDEAWSAMMDDCQMYSYKPYFVALADSFPPTRNDRALEFFVTIAVAYGRKDPEFLYAGRKVLIRAEQLRQQQAASSTQSVSKK